MGQAVEWPWLGVEGAVFDRLELFVPEGNRESKTTPVDLHDRWVIRLMETCGKLFTGATSFGRGVGVWTSGPRFYWDRVTVIEAWADTRKPDHARRIDAMIRALIKMGRALRQKVVGCVVGGELQLFEIRRKR